MGRQKIELDDFMESGMDHGREAVPDSDAGLARDVNLDHESVVVNRVDTDRGVVTVSGSFLESYAIDTIATYSARSATTVLFIPVMGMPQLSRLLGGLLVISPIMASLLTQIPMTWLVNKTGGKKAGIAMMSLSLTGMTSLTILFACSDISTVSSFDWRYALILASGYLIGHGTNVGLLMSDALKWVPKKIYIPNLQLLYSLLVDSTTVTTPILAYYLSSLGYAVPFSIFTGLALFGGVIALGLGHPSPYYQFRAKFPHERAKELAVESGQLEELIKNYDNVSLWSMAKENLTVLFDRRSLLLGFTIFSSLGSFFVSRNILPRLLKEGFGLSASDAIITSSLASLITILSRSAASKLIEHLDGNSGTVKVHIFGCGSAMIGSTALAVFNLPRWGLYTSLALSNMGFGVNMATPLSLATAWSKSVDGKLPKINPSTMFSWFGTFGSLWGIILPLFLGLLVDESGEQWNKQYFYIILTMMMISMLCVPIVDYQVNRKPGPSLFQSAVSFFGRKANIRGQEQYAVRNETVLDVEAQEERDDKINVDLFF